MMNRAALIFWIFQSSFLLYNTFVSGFVPKNNNGKLGWGTTTTTTTTTNGRTNHVAMTGNFFDDWKIFFNGENDKGNNNNNNNNDGEEDEYAAGQVNVVTIPVKEIKPGGLRLFLMFYLMGLQNTPEKGTWRADQPTSEDYVVDFWYHDHSAVLSVTLSDERKKITIDRVGSRPSTGYMIQESLIVQGLLDELETMATDPDVAVENRLVIPETEHSIRQARDALAFG